VSSTTLGAPSGNAPVVNPTASLVALPPDASSATATSEYAVEGRMPTTVTTCVPALPG
jgi:hypothetical protein